MIPAYTVTHVRSWTWIKFAQKPDQSIRQRIYRDLRARHCHGRGEWYIRSLVDEREIARVIRQDSSTIDNRSNLAYAVIGGNTMTPDEQTEFVDQYLAAARWAEGDEGEYALTPESPELRQQAEVDCAEFAKRAGSMIAGNETRAAHDFWLTRSGAGAGFWDGDWPEHGDELTAICKQFPELDLYTGDDGLLYFGGWQEPEAMEASNE